MRFLQLVPIALVASYVSAAVVLPLAVSGALKIVNRDISSTCINLCNKVRNEHDACGTDMACACTTSIATQLEQCVDCQVEGDPSSAYDLQTGLDQYASGCNANGYSVGTLSVSVPASVTSTASTAAGSATAVLASTTSTPPAFGTSFSTSAGIISSTFAPSTSASASATTSASGNSATAKDVRMTGALVAAGLAAVYAIV